MIEYSYLEHIISKELDRCCVRSLAVIDPVVVHIVNLAENEVREILAPDFPYKPEGNKHKIRLSRKVYVEREDIRTVDHPDFLGLAPGKLIGLKYAGVFKVIEVK